MKGELLHYNGYCRQCSSETLKRQNTPKVVKTSHQFLPEMVFHHFSSAEMKECGSLSPSF